MKVQQSSATNQPLEISESHLEQVESLISQASQTHTKLSRHKRIYVLPARYSSQPVLYGRYWQVQFLQAQIGLTEQFISNVIDGTANLRLSELSSALTNQTDKLLETLFFSNFARLHSSRLTLQVEEYRQLRAKEAGFTTANMEAALLKAKAEAAADHWRQPGVSEALFSEVQAKLERNSIETQTLAAALVWELTLASLKVAIESYSQLVDSYCEAVAFIETQILQPTTTTDT